MAEGGRRAAFLDRDGTLLEDPGFLHQPGQARLLPGAAAAVRRLNDAGVLVVTVSNQSGIARGLYTAADYHTVQRRLAELLAAPPHQAHLDGGYFCPHHPDVTGPCDCRKPGTRLFEEARAALGGGIDFTRSSFPGGRPTDRPGLVLVVAAFAGEHEDQARALGVTVVADVAAAVQEILSRP